MIEVRLVILAVRTITSQDSHHSQGSAAGGSGHDVSIIWHRHTLLVIPLVWLTLTLWHEIITKKFPESYSFGSFARACGAGKADLFKELHTKFVILQTFSFQNTLT